MIFGWKNKYDKLNESYDSLKKDLAKKCEEVTDLNIEVSHLKSSLENKIGEIEFLNLQEKTQSRTIKELRKDNQDLKLSNEQLTTENKELHELNDNIFRQNQNLKSDRYLVRKVKGTKATKEDIKTMGIKRGATKVAVKKELKEKGRK